MGDNALKVNKLTKKYRDFILDEATFNVPKGTIVGLVGKNGSGKSTSIGLILGLIKKDSGDIQILGKQNQEINFETRNKIGVVFDGNNFPDYLTPKKLNKLLKNIYSSWNENKYFSYLENLSLPFDKKIKEFSKGMKTKLQITAAISHDPELLILDEPTSGLDPVVRDDILDMLLDFIQNEKNSVLISSHITSDLEKIADYIVFIHDGKIMFEKQKDELRYKYGVIKCETEQFYKIDPKDIIAYRKQDYEWQILVSDRFEAIEKYPNTIIDSASIDDIMLLYIKGKQK